MHVQVFVAVVTVNLDAIYYVRNTCRISSVVFNLFRAQSKFIGFFTKQTSTKHQLKVKIFPCVLYSIQLCFGGIINILIIIIFVDILQVGSVSRVKKLQVNI